MYQVLEMCFDLLDVLAGEQMPVLGNFRLSLQLCRFVGKTALGDSDAVQFQLSFDFSADYHQAALRKGTYQARAVGLLLFGLDVQSGQKATFNALPLHYSCSAHFSFFAHVVFWNCETPSTNRHDAKKGTFNIYLCHSDVVSRSTRASIPLKPLWPHY